MKLLNLKGALSIQIHCLVLKNYSREKFECNLIRCLNETDYEQLAPATGNVSHNQKRYHQVRQLKSLTTELKALSHDTLFLATCTAVLLLRDGN